MGKNKGGVCKEWRKGRKEWGGRKRERGDRGRVGERGRRKMVRYHMIKLFLRSDNVYRQWICVWGDLKGCP